MLCQAVYFGIFQSGREYSVTLKYQLYLFSQLDIIFVCTDL